MAPTPTATPHSHFIKRSLWISYIFLGLGFAFLGWLIYKLGVREILENLRSLGWNCLLALLPSFFSHILYTQAWMEFLKKGKTFRVPIYELFKVKTVGEAVNMVNPLSWGGGDPVRIYLLRKWVPVAEATASVVVDRTVNSMATAVFMIIGIFIAFVEFNIPLPYKIGFSLSLAFILAMTAYWYRKQHEGIFQFLIHTLTRLRIKRHWSEKTLQKVKEIDGLIKGFYTHNRVGFALSFLLQFVVRLMGVVEIYLVAFFLGGTLDWVDSYLLASLTIIVNMIFVFIPGSVGVLEGTYAGVFHLIHRDPAMGTSIQIFRRLRMILWTAIGFYYIYHLDRKTRRELKELAEHPSLDELDVSSQPEGS